MRALLVVNRKATTTSERSRDVLVGALRSVADVEVAHTRRRGHGGTLAAEAARAGVDLVVTSGGDGTVNEVVNGLMAVGTAGCRAARAGGGAGWLDERVRSSARPAAGLGRGHRGDSGRAAGRAVPHHRAGPGRRPLLHVLRRARVGRGGGPPGGAGPLARPLCGPGAYVRATVGEFLLDRGRNDLRSRWRWRTRGATNSPPWWSRTPRRGRTCSTARWTRTRTPRSSCGLDVLAVRQLRMASTARTLRRLLARTPSTRPPPEAWHDLPRFVVRASAHNLPAGRRLPGRAATGGVRVRASCATSAVLSCGFVARARALACDTPRTSHPWVLAKRT